MKQRLLFAILIGLAAMLLASCAATPQYIPAPAPIEPTRGHWDGNTFASAYFGLRFELPMGWAPWDDMDHPSIPHIPPGGQITPDMMVLAGNDVGVYFDMRASHEDAVGDIFHTSTVVVMLIMYYPDEAGPISEQSILLESQASAAQFDNVDFIIHEAATPIGANDWYSADHIVSGDNFYVRMFLRVDGRFVKQINIISYDDDGLHEIFAQFGPY